MRNAALEQGGREQIRRKTFTNTRNAMAALDLGGGEKDWPNKIPNRTQGPDRSLLTRIGCARPKDGGKSSEKRCRKLDWNA